MTYALLAELKTMKGAQVLRLMVERCQRIGERIRQSQDALVAGGLAAQWDDDAAIDRAVALAAGDYFDRARLSGEEAVSAKKTPAQWVMNAIDIARSTLIMELSVRESSAPAAGGQNVDAA